MDLSTDTLAKLWPKASDDVVAGTVEAWADDFFRAVRAL